MRKRLELLYSCGFSSGQTLKHPQRSTLFEPVCGVRTFWILRVFGCHVRHFLKLWSSSSYSKHFTIRLTCFFFSCYFTLHYISEAIFYFLLHWIYLIILCTSYSINQYFCMKSQLTENRLAIQIFLCKTYEYFMRICCFSCYKYV